MTEREAAIEYGRAGEGFQVADEAHRVALDDLEDARRREASAATQRRIAERKMFDARARYDAFPRETV